MFLTLNLNIGILFLCFWDLDFSDLESLFSESPNKAVDNSVDLEMIKFDRPKEVTSYQFILIHF